jgi:mitochondrial import receptor subunit TOM40
MGNVQAMEMAPPQSPSPDVDRNPGTVEDLHNRCKEVFPMAFEGCKLLVQKGLSNNFQVSHSLTMSNMMQSGYRFGATYVGAAKVISVQEAYPILIGDMDPSGNLQANIIHAPTDNLRTKMMVAIQENKWQSLQLTADYKGKDYTASLTTANPDLFSGTGMGVAHYLQSVTPSLALGAELAYQASPQIPGGHIGVLSCLARYAGPDFSISGTISNAGSLHACFYQKCSSDLSVGTELETNLRMGSSVATVGYKVDMPRAGLVFKGAVNSDWEVKAVLEKKLLPIPFTLALCGIINHPKQSFQMGAGLIVG